MIGRASLSEINHLKSIGIDHKGEVTDEEKLELYSRARVFLYPSSREGFGIALAESLQLGMASVIWRLPVFEELYSDSIIAKQGRVRLVEKEDYQLFASEALKALDSHDMRNRIIPVQQTPSSSTTTATTTSSPVSSESKKAAATISILKIKEEEEEHRSEVLQSWEDVAHKVVKVLSELI
jgi:glycosyltransferase involved in cell wall biosynthesis